MMEHWDDRLKFCELRGNWDAGGSYEKISVTYQGISCSDEGSDDESVLDCYVGKYLPGQIGSVVMTMKTIDEKRADVNVTTIPRLM